MARSSEQQPAEFPYEARTVLLVGLGYVSGFVLVVFLLSVLIETAGGEILLVAMLVPFIPFLIMMASNEQVRRIAASSGPFNLEILFNREVRTEMQSVSLEEQSISPDAEITDFPAAYQERPIMDESVHEEAIERRSVLWFRLGESVTRDTVTEFLELMPRLSYVIFTDSGDRFQGLMSANDFRSVYWDNPQGLLDRIESRTVLEIAGVVTETITPDATNVDALEKMGDNVTKLAVVDDDEEFTGVITQDAISRGILLELFEQAEF